MLGWSQFFTNDNVLALALDTPTGDRIECGRAHGFAGLQTETGVMPRAPNSPVDDYAVGQRAVIVGAVGANGKDLVARPREEDLFIVDTTEQHVAVA